MTLCTKVQIQGRITRSPTCGPTAWREEAAPKVALAKDTDLPIGMR